MSRLRAPAADNGVLTEPPASEWPALAQANAERLDTGGPVAGIPLAELRRQARREAVDAARAYLEAAGQGADLPRAADDTPLVVAGHQPDLFHPGVWVKNFALNGLACAAHALPLNLVVDQDTLKNPSLHLPVWGGGPRPASPDDVRLLPVPYDAAGPEVAFEERGTHDRGVFDTFAERVAEHLREWPEPPMLPDVWKRVRAISFPTLGERFAFVRRERERDWGVFNLELPLSVASQLPSFATLACHLLADLPSFAEGYNIAVRDYRKSNAVRSKNHPVPDLARDGPRVEAPLWAWRAGESRRGRLFVERVGDTLELSAEGRSVGTLPAAFGDGFVSAWRDLAAAGWKLRSKALLTTLYARLLLGDFFLHGIGGGKYDEVTDAIVSRTLGLPVPAFAVATATVRLPIERFPATSAGVRAARRRERDLRWNPQRFTSEDGLMEERERVLREEPADRLGQRQRFRRLQAITAMLSERLAGEREQAAAETGRLREALAANGLLGRRDIGFPLFAEARLREFMSAQRVAACRSGA